MHARESMPTPYCKRAYDRITISNVMATYQVHLWWQQNKTQRLQFSGKKCNIKPQIFSWSTSHPSNTSKQSISDSTRSQQIQTRVDHGFIAMHDATVPLPEMSSGKRLRQ